MSVTPEYKNKNVISYSRVSTIEQARDGISLPDQVAEMEAFARQHGLHIKASFSDAHTARNEALVSHRQGFNAACELAVAYGSPILVQACDRFSRTYASYMRFIDRGGKLIAVELGMDANELEIGALMKHSESEGHKSARLSRAGQQTARKNGAKIGNPRLGEARIKSAAARDEKARLFREDFHKRHSAVVAAGARSLDEIATALNATGYRTARKLKWTPSNTNRMLREIKLVGNMPISATSRVVEFEPAIEVNESPDHSSSPQVSAVQVPALMGEIVLIPARESAENILVIECVPAEEGHEAAGLSEEKCQEILDILGDWEGILSPSDHELEVIENIVESSEERIHSSGEMYAAAEEVSAEDTDQYSDNQDATVGVECVTETGSQCEAGESIIIPATRSASRPIEALREDTAIGAPPKSTYSPPVPITYIPEADEEYIPPSRCAEPAYINVNIYPESKTDKLYRKLDVLEEPADDFALSQSELDEYFRYISVMFPEDPEKWKRLWLAANSPNLQAAGAEQVRRFIARKRAKAGSAPTIDSVMAPVSA